MAKDLELALRLKADMAKAKQQVDDVAKSVDDLGEAGKGAADNLETTGAAIDKIDSDLQQVQRELQGTAATFNYVGKAAYSFRNDMRGVGQQSQVTAEEVGRLVNTYDALAQETKRLATDQQLLDRALKQGKITQEQYARATQNLNQRTIQLGNGFRSLRGQASNIGFQLQDIAVQAQAGVRPTTILAQQGSQLVGAINPLAGAAIAVGAALLGALIPGMSGASDAAEGLSDNIKELNKDYKNLTDAQRDALAKTELDNQKSLQTEIDKTSVKIKNLEKTIADYQSRLQRQPITTVQQTGLNGPAFNAAQDSAQIQKRITEATTDLSAARAVLDNKTQELTNSEREYNRILGKDIADPLAQATQARELIKNLTEQRDLYGKTGIELGKYVAEKLNQTGATRDTIVALYSEIEAQKQATKAQADAKAEAEKLKRENEARARTAENYVKTLERQAAAIGKNRQQLQALAADDKNLNTSQSKRAAAANAAINAQEDAKVLAQLQADLLNAQGQNQEQAQQAFIKKYRDMLAQMEPAARATGEAIVNQLINLNGLQGKLDDAQQKISKALAEQQRGETSLNTQREAGLITEADARERILELHRQTYALLQQQRPVLEQLAQQPNEIGVQAKQVLAELDAQSQLLLITVNELEQTLKNSLTSGISDALQGLAKGTYTLREAINSLATTVRDALLKMAADNIAQRLVGSLFSGGKNSGQELSEGATKTTAAAAALTSSAALWNVTAARIQQAAASLAASNAGGGSSSSGSSGGEYGQYLQLAAAVFAADGGHITGPGTSTSDSIPAMLSNNEFVTRAAVVNQQGALDFLSDFNSRGMAALADWAPVRHATGGLAGYPAPSRPAVSIPSSITQRTGGGTTLHNAQNFILVDDPARLGDYLKTQQGQETLVVMMSRDPQKFKSALKIGG